MNIPRSMPIERNLSLVTDFVAKYKGIIWIAMAVFFGILTIVCISFFRVSKRDFLPAVLENGGSKKEYSEKFGKEYSVEESGKRSESSSKNWWVNSGGRLIVSHGAGKTILGDLPASDKWHKAYKKSNPKDTDNGQHPQNIFRLVGREKFKNFSQEVFFRIRKINMSSSDNRNESNGFLLFNRYQNGDDLYYAGLRVDGYAVIKKKIDGDYFTLDSKKIFSGGEYDRDANPNLLPINKWMGIRSAVETNKDGDVEIGLYWKKRKNKGKWKLVAHYIDKGKKGDKIEDEGYGGIRTDFMDVEFDNYKIKEL
jgi:hypothetical protein